MLRRIVLDDRTKPYAVHLLIFVIVVVETIHAFSR